MIVVKDTITGRIKYFTESKLLGEFDLACTCYEYDGVSTISYVVFFPHWSSSVKYMGEPIYAAGHRLADDLDIPVSEICYEFRFDDVPFIGSGSLSRIYH